MLARLLLEFALLRARLLRLLLAEPRLCSRDLGGDAAEHVAVCGIFARRRLGAS